MSSLSKNIFVLFVFVFLAFTGSVANAASEKDCPSFDKPGGKIEGIFNGSDDIGDHYLIDIDGEMSVTCQEDLILQWFGGAKPIGKRVAITYNDFQTFFHDNNYCVQIKKCTSGTVIE